MDGFEGVLAAAITPRGKHGDIDFGAAFELIDFLARGRVHGIVLFAAEGEYPAFTAQERSRLIYLAVKRSRVPVFAGVGSATPDESLTLAREARDAGAAALLVPPPHFFQYDQEDIRAFYRQFAAGVSKDTPSIIYHTSEASAISEETAAELLGAGCFAGLIDSAGNAESFARLSAVGQVLVSDATMMRVLAPGVLSGAACAAPEVVTALQRALRAGAEDRATRLRGGLRELLDWAARFPSPTLWKVAARLQGLKTGAVAATLSPRKLRALEEFQRWFPDWLARFRTLAANA